MINKLLVKLVATLATGFFLLACTSVSSGVGGASPSAENVPGNSQAPSNGEGQGPASESAEISVQLPLSPEVPPADVIQQITWTGGGAGSDGPGSDGPDCNSNCFVPYEDGIVLSYFPPNQLLRIDVFYPTGASQAGAGVYEFLTELAVRTDKNGAFEISLDRNPQLFQFIVLDEDGNLIFQPKGIGDIQYAKSTPDCPGNLSSRLGVGMRAQVTSDNVIPLQGEPNTNPSDYFADLDEGTTMNIQAGPQCNEGMVWWQVTAELSDGIYGGWTAEGDQSSWYLEPLP